MEGNCDIRMMRFLIIHILIGWYFYLSHSLYRFLLSFSMIAAAKLKNPIYHNTFCTPHWFMMVVGYGIPIPTDRSGNRCDQSEERNQGM
jgi:hypothetical protein